MTTVLDSIEIQGFIYGQGVSSRSPVRVATTFAGTLGTSFTAGTVIDGVTLSVDDRILIKNQGLQTENGIYIVTTGTPTRSLDCDTGASFSGVVTIVTDGTINASSSWICTNSYSSGIIGTNNITIDNYTKYPDASALRTTGASVTMAGSAPPTTGQMLTATSATTATWQTVTSGNFVDTTTFVVSNADPTKRMRFSDTAAVTGTTLILANNQTTSQTLNLPNITTTDTLATRAGVETLSNKTLTAPVISSITNTGLLTLPTITDTLVGRTTTDTLSNKTLTAPVISTITNTGTLTLPITTDTLVGRTTVDTLSNKTLTAPIISAITNVGTLTLPTTTDTLVGRTTTDNLSNKTLISPVISTINNVGTLTLPSVSDTLVGRVTTDTLTNKTLTGNTNTIHANAIKTSGLPVIVSAAAPPSTGYMLTATSATSATWQAPAVVTGGNFVDTTSFIVNNVDATKILQYNNAAATTGTTLVLANNQTTSQTLNIPNITATDTLVTRTTTDTLTNKTLTAPVIATITNGGVLTLPTGTDVIVSRTATETLSNKTLTAPVISTISNVGTLSLPTVTDTLVGRLTTDTLTNKTITGTTNIVHTDAIKTSGTSVSVSAAAPPTTGQLLTATSATTATWQVPAPVTSGNFIDTTSFIVNGIDATKRLAYNNVGATTGTTLTIANNQTTSQTLNLPNITATDTLATRTGTETLSNKTLTTPTISSITNGGTLTLPTGTDTIVSRTATETLSNKTLTAPVVSTIVNVGTLTLPTVTDTLIGRTTTDTLSNKTLTLPIIASIFNGGVVTLPSGAGVIVARTTTDTLTNKTITDVTNTVYSDALKTTGTAVSVSAASPPATGQLLTATSATTATWQAPAAVTTGNFIDTTTFIVSNLDATKRVRFSDAAAGTGTTLVLANNQTTSQTLNIPNITTTDTLSTRAGVETLSNKTLTAPVISTISNTGVLTLPTVTDTLVGRTTTDTLINKTLTAPVISSIVNVGVLTLPAATDTLIGRATTDTLSNKTLTAPIIATISNTGTLTLPTTTDTLIGRVTTDTLSNKTLTAPVIATIVNVGTLSLPTTTDTLVGRATTDTLSNKTLTAPVIASIVNVGTLTLPVGPDTIVSRTATETLSNKTLTAPVITSISNTGTLTLPTTTDTLVGRTTTDTFTNKTLTAASNTVHCDALKTTGLAVSVSASAPPATGQLLVATSATTATWQTPSIIVAPGGSNTQVQYNMAGTLAGAANLVIDTVDSFPIIDGTTGLTLAPTAVNGVKLYGRNKAGRTDLACIDRNLSPYAFQAAIASSSVALFSAHGNGTTVTVIGLGNTATGATTRNVAATNNFTMTKRIGYQTASPAGNSAGTRSGLLQYCMGGLGFGGFYFVSRFGVSQANAQSRFFVGMYGTAAAIGNVDPSTLTNVIGFGKDSLDINYQLIYGGSTVTKVNLGIAGNTAGVIYVEVALFVESNTNVIGYSIQDLTLGGSLVSGTVTGTFGITIPATTTLLSPQVWVNNGGTGSAAALDLSTIYIETN